MSERGRCRTWSELRAIECSLLRLIHHAEAAAVLGVTVEYLRAERLAGRLRAIWHDGRCYVSRAEVLTLLAPSEREGQP